MADSPVVRENQRLLAVESAERMNSLTNRLRTILEEAVKRFKGSNR